MEPNETQSTRREENLTAGTNGHGHMRPFTSLTWRREDDDLDRAWDRSVAFMTRGRKKFEGMAEGKVT